MSDGHNCLSLLSVKIFWNYLFFYSLPDDWNTHCHCDDDESTMHLSQKKVERINFNQYGWVHLNDIRKLRANICKIQMWRVKCAFAFACVGWKSGILILRKRVMPLTNKNGGIASSKIIEIWDYRKMFKPR